MDSHYNSPNVGGMTYSPTTEYDSSDLRSNSQPMQYYCLNTAPSRTLNCPSNKIPLKRPLSARLACPGARQAIALSPLAPSHIIPSLYSTKTYNAVLARAVTDGSV